MYIDKSEMGLLSNDAVYQRSGLSKSFSEDRFEFLD